MRRMLRLLWERAEHSRGRRGSGEEDSYRGRQERDGEKHNRSGHGAASWQGTARPGTTAGAAGGVHGESWQACSESAQLKSEGDREGSEPTLRCRLSTS